MAGVILETLSNRKLIAFAVVMFILQIGFFLIGGLIAPSPNNVQQLLSNICIDDHSTKHNSSWLYPRGTHGRCTSRYTTVSEAKHDRPDITETDLVFTFQFPNPRGYRELEMFKLHQSMIAVLHFVMEDIDEKDIIPVPESTEITFDVRLGYSNEDGHESWTELANSREVRQLKCNINAAASEYDCDMVPFFELGSVHHKSYLVNLRLPASDNANRELGPVKEMWAYIIHSNRGFVFVWFSIKTVVFPPLALALLWFIWRLYHIDRKPNILEQTLVVLGAALTLLNIPVDWLTLWISMPFMVLYSDIRQVIFYSILFCFWVIFIGEHVMDQVKRNHIVYYWKQLCAVGFGCICLFVFEMCERGVQLTNPFYSIWATDVGRYLGLTFIILAGLAAGIYFVYLLAMVVKVFRTIMAKKAVLPITSKLQRDFCMGLIYRFSFLMVFTLLCAAMTVILFIVGQVREGQWKWGDAGHLEYTSAVQTGVYGMWNIYVFSLIILYAPSHKYVAAEIGEWSRF